MGALPGSATKQHDKGESRLKERVRQLNDVPVRQKADYVLYWAQMNRRVHGNHALDWAINMGNELNLPVLFYEGLTCSYPNANDRLHTFILEGAAEMAEGAQARGVGYAFYLRRRRTDPNDLVYQLAAHAAAVITDDYPTFIAAVHNSRVPEKIGAAYFAVDSSCIIPMSKWTKREYAAYTIRPRIHRLLPDYFHPAPELTPIRKWKGAPPKFHVNVHSGNIAELVASCEIDHSVRPSTSYRGGRHAAETRLESFLQCNLKRYGKARNEPTEHATSNLSPYLHFGQISSLEVALRAKAFGEERRIGTEEFLEELIVRRELAFNFARWTTNLEGFDDVPDWAKKTMAAHAGDERNPLLRGNDLEAARSYDPLWNATQKELLLRGKIHGYFRMYWGKKIIEWCPTYEEALRVMIDLHDRYALDGRDPNTYTSVLWCFGLHDRPWFERPVFGTMRYMSFEGMKRKTNIRAYMEEIAELERTGADPLAVPA